MRDTPRESTARLRGEDANHVAESVPISALGFGPHLSIPCLEYCQGLSLLSPSICGPMLSCIAGAVDTSYSLHNRTNGSTVSLIHGDMAGSKLFSVAPYPSHSITLWERPTWEELFDYAKAKLALLIRPGHGLGTWFNDWDLVHCLDVVVLVRDCNTALEIGRRAGQLAIFDLEARREIQIPRSSQKSGAGLVEVENGEGATHRR